MFSLDFQKLDEEIFHGRIREFKHQDYPTLSGYNYTDSCQYLEGWNDITLMCRGIIFDNKKCIARPYSKFFNIEEISENISKKEISFVQNKEDGSLIISYIFDGKINFSTRGSFHSNQARLATNLWYEKYQKSSSNYLDIENLCKENTFLFELVGPSNRNVLRSYTEDELILLSIINIETGQELNNDLINEIANKICCKRPRLFMANNTGDLYDGIKLNKSLDLEGVVVTFKDGMKVKIKSSLYVELHKVLTGNMSRETKIALWEESRNKEFCISFNLINSIPDEYFSDIKKEVSAIEDRFKEYCYSSNQYYIEMRRDYLSGMTRKDMAMKWGDFKWMLSSIFSDKEDINDLYMKMFKKKYLEGIYD